jgi:hypothetical protein
VVLALGGQRRRIDPQLVHQAARLFTVRKRRFDPARPSSADQESAVDVKLVALGVAAEIVVIVQDEDPRVLPGFLAEVVGRCQAADARANHHQVVHLSRVGHRTGFLPEGAVPHLVPRLERAHMAAAHASR